MYSSGRRQHDCASGAALPMETETERSTRTRADKKKRTAPRAARRASPLAQCCGQHPDRMLHPWLLVSSSVVLPRCWARGVGQAAPQLSPPRDPPHQHRYCYATDTDTSPRLQAHRSARGAHSCWQPERIRNLPRVRLFLSAVMVDDRGCPEMPRVQSQPFCHA